MSQLHQFGIRLLPIVLLSLAVEIGWFVLVARQRYPWREMATSLGVYVLRVPMRLLTPLVVGPVALFLWSHRVATIPTITLGGLTLLFFSVEFAYYWMHRAAHEIRWLWASHVVHHTPEQIHLASSLRLGATELVSGNWLFYMPLYLLGFDPVSVSGMLAFNLFYQFWLHTEAIGQLGPLEWMLNTPSHHRVHHASNGEYLDRNYGGVLIIWDRLFGTFAAERPQIAITYGLVHPVGTRNPIKLAFHEWVVMARDVVGARSWRERMQQVVGRPDESLSSRSPENGVPTAAALPVT